MSFAGLSLKGAKKWFWVGKIELKRVCAGTNGLTQKKEASYLLILHTRVLNWVFITLQNMGSPILTKFLCSNAVPLYRKCVSCCEFVNVNFVAGGLLGLRGY